jgi:hypothetical protein
MLMRQSRPEPDKMVGFGARCWSAMMSNNLWSHSEINTPVRLSRVCLVIATTGLVMPACFAADNTPLTRQTSTPVVVHDGAHLAIVEAPVAKLPSQLPNANFERESASLDARQMANWVVRSADNANLPFVIVDKKNAKVFAFSAAGQIIAAVPALLGLAVGDEAVPNIGNRPLSSIRPEERTTPAGRFVASLDRNAHGKEILWVDYDGAISLHPVVKGTLEERRAQRLASPTPLDNRISFGCINVPPDFFENVVHRLFAKTSGIVYVLPEIRSLSQVFPKYSADQQSQNASEKLTLN